MDVLGAQARESFLTEQKFEEDALLQGLHISFVRVAKFSDATLSQSQIPWLQATQLCQRLNNPVKNEHGNSAKAILTMVRFDRDLNGTLNMDSETFLDVFDDFGFHPYWLHLILHSVYGHFSLWRENGTLYTSYFNTASSTLLWSHDLSTLSTKVVIIPRLPPAYNDFLRSVHSHKDMIDDWRFCSLVCSIQTIHWVERSVGDHLKAVRIIESETGYGVWHTSEGAKDRKDTQLLVKISEKTGSILTELSNIARHASIARSVLNDLSQPRNPPSSQHSIALSSAVNVPTSQAPISFVNQTVAIHSAHNTNKAVDLSIADEISSLVAILGGQVASGELAASYLQERARTQHSVIFNLLTRHDAETSKEIAQAARKDSYSMKTIAIVTMVFLPPTFFATLFAMPMLKWDSAQVVQPTFKTYWAVAMPITVLVLWVWHYTSEEVTIFRKCWNQIVLRSKTKTDPDKGSLEDVGINPGSPQGRKALRKVFKSNPLASIC